VKTLRAAAELIGLWLLITVALAAAALVLSPIDPLQQPAHYSKGAV
jgi:hypothetical protein